MRTFFTIKNGVGFVCIFALSVIAFGSLMASPNVAAGSSIVSTTTADGDGADSYIAFYSTSSAPSDRNYGGETLMQAKNASADVDRQIYRKSYIRFDIEGIDLTKLIDADFELTSQSWTVSQVFNVYGLDDGHANEAWQEGTGSGTTSYDWITWNNAPANDSANSIDLTEATFLGTFDGDETDSTVGLSGSVLLDFLKADTDGLVTLIVTQETAVSFTGNGGYFYAKENGNLDITPTLQMEIVDTQVPEPNTILLLLGMAVGWLSIRRK